MSESGEGQVRPTEQLTKHKSPINTHDDRHEVQSKSDNKTQTETTNSRLNTVREKLARLSSLASEKLIPREPEPIPIEEITEDTIVEAMLRARPKEISGRADLNFGIGEIEDELGWSNDVPIEARSLLQETIRRKLSNLSTKGEVKIIPVHDKDGRFIRRDYQITNTERQKLEDRTINHNQNIN